MEKLINDFSFGLFFWQILSIVMVITFVWGCLLLIKNQRETSISKAVWVAAFFFVPIISSVFYIVNFYVNRKK